MIDKNQAVIDYITQCPAIQNSALFFNFIKAEDGTSHIVTQTTERYSNKPYIDGTVEKIYSCQLILYKSIADIAVVQIGDYANEGVLDMSDIQALIDWIKEQDELRNYPNFGETCIIQSIDTTTDNPSFDGIDDQVSPNLAVYSVIVEIDYLDISKKIWR